MQEYMDWLQLRPENLLRLMEVMKHHLLVELPAALAPGGEAHATPVAMLAAVVRIKELYDETLELEREGRAIMPPESMASVHQIQCGLAFPIRDAVQQMLTFLDRVSELDTARSHHVEFEIVFAEPPGIDALTRELAKANQEIAMGAVLGATGGL